MSRQHSGNFGRVDFRRPNRSYNSSAPRSWPENPQAFSIGPNTSESSPVNESDSEKGGNQPRRRIALACSRCRKRKIKCSGDLGHGQGCQNCKNAGSDSSNCQFLRVNSTNTLYTPPVPCPWPYTIGSTSGAAHIESSLGQYSSATASMASSQPSTVSYAGSNHFSRPPVSGLPSVSYPAVPPRHLHASHYSPGFTDDVYDPYGISTNQYHGLAQESQAASAGYATQDSGRNWIPIVPNNRISYGGSNFDADPPLRYGSSGLSHINGSTATAVSSDGTSFFPGMNSLASSLPVPPPSGDRTLPNPAKRASLINYGSISQGILGESVPAGLPLNLNDKHGVPCAAPSSMVDGSQAPINSTSLSTTSASGPATNRSTSSPRGSQNTATFGYMSLSRSPASAPHVAPASAYESANLSTSTGSIESHLGLADPAFQNTLCIEDLITSHESPSNMYSYSLGKSGSIDHVGPEGPLVSGQTYTSLRQPRPQHGASYGALRDDTLDSSPHVPQRTSISSISNGRSY